MQIRFTYMSYIQIGYHLRALKVCLNVFFPPQKPIFFIVNVLGNIFNEYLHPCISICEFSYIQDLVERECKIPDS